MNPSKLEIAFVAFHAANPIVYDQLVLHAREWKLGGHTRLAICTLYEHTRWTLAFGRAPGDSFKMSNNHRAYYARLIMEQEDDLAGFFTLRTLKFPCTFGPDNSGLSSGEHVA
jgi:hypothetical protein